MVLYSTRIKTALRNASLVIRMRRTLPDGIHLVGQATLQRGLYYILVWIWARNLADPQCVLLAASIRNRTVGQRGPRASEPSAGNEVWSTTLAAPLGAITTATATLAATRRLLSRSRNVNYSRLFFDT